MNARTRGSATLAALPPLVALLTGCGSTESSPPAATHTMKDGTVMSGPSMAGMQPSDGMSADDGSAAGGPSETASMICGDEIRGAVRRTLELSKAPVGLHSWAGQLYSCTYQLSAGDLRLSVKDLDRAGPGRAYFDSLRRRLPQARAIRGLANFGFPAFETQRGDVVFIKDDKTLWVDASRLRTDALPSGTSRQDVAYGVASAVIACWTE